MGAKRPHRKTRTGCKTCRNRRVKCDEESPVCGNCWKRDIECIWVDPSIASSSTSSLDPKTPTPSPSQKFDLPLTIPSASTIPLDLSTLELMHHYTNTICFTIHGYELPIAEVWKSVVPALAFSSHAHFLLHALLALSALHLSQTHTDPSLSLKYTYAATAHYNNAKRAFVDLLDTIPEPDGMGVGFVTHQLLAIYSYACSNSVLSADWILFFRRHISHSKVRDMWHQYARSPIAPMLFHLSDKYRQYLNLQPFESDSTFYQFPERLSTIHLPTSGASNPQEVLDPEISEAYAGAVRATKKVLFISSNPGVDIQYLTWFINVPHEYLLLLWQRRPRALVIAAHYCAIMSHINVAQVTPWWVPAGQRWQNEIDEIRGQLGDEWDDWLPPRETSFEGMESALTAWIGSVVP